MTENTPKSYVENNVKIKSS